MTAQIRGDAADILYHGPHPVVRRMAHVETEDVGASQYQSAELLW